MEKHRTWIYSFIYLLLFVLSSCTSTSDETAKATLEPKAFNEQVQSGQGILLDVRTPEEYQEGLLADAQNIDYKNTSFEESLEQLDKDKTYYVYCKAGVRSEKAVELMQKKGFTSVYHMKGGIDAWKKEGLPLKN
jgi:rhodanese-related sulfurtransferase